MKAFTRSKYGGPEVLHLEEVEKPALKDDHILVKVMANSANPADWHIIRGKPFGARFAFGLFKPAEKIPGADFSGIVEGTGKDVTGSGQATVYSARHSKVHLLNIPACPKVFAPSCRKERNSRRWHVCRLPG